MQNSWALFFQFVRCKAHVYTNQFRVWVKATKWRPPRERIHWKSRGQQWPWAVQTHPSEGAATRFLSQPPRGGQGRRASSRWINNDVVWSIALTMLQTPQVSTQLRLIGWVEGYLGRNSIHIPGKLNKFMLFKDWPCLEPESRSLRVCFQTILLRSILILTIPVYSNKIISSDSKLQALSL